MGDSAYVFLGMIIDSAGGSASDRMAFKVYALQRLHAANFRGVAAVISSRPVIRTGPGVPPGFGLQPLGTARPMPAISFRSLRGIARQAITTTTNHNNFAAARLTSSTQGAGVLLSYCLSSPVQSARRSRPLARRPLISPKARVWALPMR